MIIGKRATVERPKNSPVFNKVAASHDECLRKSVAQARLDFGEEDPSEVFNVHNMPQWSSSHEDQGRALEEKMELCTISTSPAAEGREGRKGWYVEK